MLAVKALSEQPGDGDHFWLRFIGMFRPKNNQKKPEGQQFRFYHTRKLVENIEDGQLEAWAFSCTSESKWNQTLCDLDTAWQIWCQDVETWLTRNGILDQGKPERPLGSAPKTQTKSTDLRLLRFHQGKKAKAGPSRPATLDPPWHVFCSKRFNLL